MKTYKTIEMEYNGKLYNAAMVIYTKKNPDYGPEYIQEACIDSVEEYDLFDSNLDPLKEPLFIKELKAQEISPQLLMKLQSSALE